MSDLVLVESNTTGSGRQFCAAARGLGLRPVLLTTDAARYAYVDADHIDTVTTDTSDVDAVLRSCSRLDPTGVLSSSEYYVPVAAAAAMRLGLLGPDPEAVRRCRDKSRQRAALDAAGVPIPSHITVVDADGAATAAAALGDPVVVKPTDGSGSVGVRRCADPSEARAWAAHLLDRPGNERGLPTAATLLVEEFVDGPEFSVETLDGEIVAVVGKHLGAAPWFVETGHDLPAAVAPGVAAELQVATQAALKALGLSWGAAHTELRMSPTGPVVIEVNPRLAGGMIPDVVRYAVGVDMVSTLVARAAGMTAPAPGTGSGAAAIRFVLAPGDGVVASTGDIDVVSARPGVVAARLTVKPHDRVVVEHTFRDRVGHVIAVAADVEQAAELASDAAAALDVRLAD